MRNKGIILLLAAVLLLSACSSGNTPAPTRTGGETLPNKPVTEFQPGELMSSKSDESSRNHVETEAPETSPIETEPAQEPTEPASQATTEAATQAATESAAETQPEEPFVMPEFYTGMIYEVSKTGYAYEDADYYYLDPEGHLLDVTKIPTPVRDVLTEKVPFYCRTEYFKTGEREEDVKVSSTLYDAEGKILEQDSPYLFTAACGDCVVRLDSRAAMMWEGLYGEYGGDLYNPYTHKVMQKDVCNIQRLNEGSALAMDAQGYVMGVVDAAGFVLTGFPMETGPYRYPMVYEHGLVSVDCEGETEDSIVRVILNNNLEYVDYADVNEYYKTFECGSKGEVLAKQLEDGTTYVFDMAEWEILAVFNDPVEDMDSRRVICQRDDVFRLYNWKGKLLAGPYEYIYPLRDNYGEDCKGYLAASGNTIYLLDLKGGVKQTMEVADLAYVTVYDGVIHCGIDQYDPKTGYYGYGMEVYNFQLKKIIPEGYDSIFRVAPGIYACSALNKQGEQRYSLFTAEGKRIFKDAISVGMGDEEAIPVVKGFNVGLIDLQGKWIAKNSKYEQDSGD